MKRTENIMMALQSKYGGTSGVVNKLAEICDIPQEKNILYKMMQIAEILDLISAVKDAQLEQQLIGEVFKGTSMKPVAILMYNGVVVPPEVIKRTLEIDAKITAMLEEVEV